MKGPELDDLVRDVKKDQPEIDWKSVDEKLFARLEQEPRPLATEEEPERGGRVVWIASAVTLAAAAAALFFVHPARDTVEPTSGRAPSAGVVSFGDVSIGANASAAHTGTQLNRGDRIDVVDQVAYFESPGAVRWASQQGSVLHVEHAASPLVLSLEKGSAEAQVTPVPSGEAFAIDVTASSGATVRVAVHGTHLRVARDGDKITVDLTEGVVSIGAPPRRGSTIGQLVTAPAHVELDARDLSSVHVDHSPSAVRPAERVTPAPRADQETAFVAPPPVQITSSPSSPHVVTSQTQKPQQPTSVVPTPPAPAMLTTPDEIASAIAACGKDAVAPQTSFSTTLSLQVGDDGTVQNARFTPPLLPEARDCAANVIYKRTKLSAGTLNVPIEINR